MALPTRRQYKGAAASTTTTLNIGPSDTSVTIAANTGWPSSAGVPFYVVLSPGTSAEEKCLATISGTSLTLTRAQDDTTAQTHASGTVIYPVFTADDADEANLIASKMTTKGDLLTTDGSDINRLGVGTNAHALIADSAATNGVKWGQVATAGIEDLAVTTAKIADLGVTAGKIAADAVTTTKILDGAVTAAKLAATAAIQPTIVDAKGDLIVGSAADTVDRLAVGTNTHVLTADSAATNGIKWAALPTQKILQVVQTVKTNTYTTTSATFTSITDLSATITPSAATSKILIIASVNVSLSNTNDRAGYLRLDGGNSGTYVGDAGSNRIRSATHIGLSNVIFYTAINQMLHTIVYLDSPSTTSATTYAVQCRTSQNDITFTVNRSGLDTDAANHGRTPSSITVIEVSA